MSRAQARLVGRTTSGWVVCVVWCREAGAALPASMAAVVASGGVSSWVWDVGVFRCGLWGVVRQ